MRCLNCDGEGIITTRFSDFELTPVTEKCWVCNGTGETDNHDFDCYWGDSQRRINEDNPRYE